MTDGTRSRDHRSSNTRGRRGVPCPPGRPAVPRGYRCTGHQARGKLGLTVAEFVYPPVIRTALAVFRALDVQIRIVGAENVPATGGAVLVSNHISYLDFLFAGLGAFKGGKRKTRFMAKDDVFKHGISGPLMRGMKHIPVDRADGQPAYDAAVRALRAGEVVGVFPEATISRSFTLKKFKTGAARMAADSGAPLLPVILWGTQQLWTKGRPQDAHQARTSPSPS